MSMVSPEFPTTGDNLKSITDRKGQITTFNQYDPTNRLKKVTFNDGSNIQYTYDVVGRATTISDSISGNLSYTYNDFGCSSCSGRGLDRIATETSPLSTINYTYDQDGRRLSMTVSGEQVANYVYDAAGRMTSLSRKIGTKTRTYPLTYDNGSRRATLKIPLSTNNKYVTTTYGYDIANRLTSMLLQGPSAQIENLLYTYDVNSNRTNFTRNAAQTLSPAMSSTSYDEANEMLSFNSKTIAYDANGSLLTKVDSCGTTTYSWDSRNRLTGISGYKPDCTVLTATFSYDALGRRISKTVNGTTTQFVYDGWDIIQEIKAGVKTNYIRTLNIDEPLTRIQGSTVRHYVRDALGSVVALTDDSGAVKTTYVYDVFGNATVSGEASDNTFQYTGRENDGTGLLYYRARYYSPEMQRFVSEDPIRLIGGVNFYEFLGGSPPNFIDPFGLINFLLGGGGSAVAPTGAEVSGGIVINPGLFGQQADAGVFSSLGSGGGVNVSSDIFIGYVVGGIENVSGETGNINVSAGPISITVFINPETGDIVGGTFGLGPSATPVGASGTYSITGTFTFRDFFRLVFGGEKTCP